MGAPDDHPDGETAHAHDFDDQPVTELGAGEPRTPGWVPMLGLGLFLVAGIYGLTALGGDSSDEDGAAASASAAPAAAPAPPQGEVVQIDPNQPRAAPPVPPIDPERARELRERIMKMREEGKLPVAPPAQGVPGQ